MSRVSERLRKPTRWAVIAILISGGLLITIGADLNYNWTGYGYVNDLLTQEQAFSRHKSIWDWLELLIIPTVLAVAAFYLNQAERRNEREVADRRLEEERKIAAERAEDAALETYLEQMSDLLINHNLREAPADDEKRTIARAWTLTIAQRLGSERKGILLQFLHEANLIYKDHSVIPLNEISLAGARLQNVNLRSTDLSSTNLTDADLSRANLTYANLTSTNLTDANLTDADLTDADLTDADLTDADLTNAFLGGTDLTRAKLNNAILNGADLRSADLRGADLTGAKLTGADLTGAKLSRADLTIANLTDNDLTRINLI